ncbi:MAG: MATE family efflux transporter, partial [Spirochaetales bacterium]
FIYILWVFASGRTTVPIAWKFRHIRLNLIWKIVSVGVPQTLAQILMSLTFLVMNRIYLSIDPLSMTAASLVGRLEQIVMIPIFALSASLLTVIGQNVGRGFLHRARTAWRTSLILSVAAVLISATLVVVPARWIFSHFSSDQGVLRYAVLQARITEYAFIFAAVAIMCRAVFQAMGRPWPAFILTGLRMLGLSLPFIGFFVYVLDWGIYGLWGGLIAGNVLGAILAFIWAHFYWNKLESGRADYRHTG